MARDSWVADRIQEFDRLRGRWVKAWSGVEMALREEAALGGGPQFEDPAVACLQMLVLGAHLSDDSFVTVGTYQDDDVWGLRLGQQTNYASAEWTGIYRLRGLPELPIGEINDVSVLLDEELLAEVVLRIHGQPVLLMAGEVYESAENRLSLVALDESVLVFTDPSAAESSEWVPKQRRK
ncbi:hypothetical protein [Actinoplanes sp. NPDC026619]|uniref:hypothetical protein n=1 Tax=Actinoplanes sp. NPDC026619 TaxID=3155798 RepID=UPI0034088333